VLPPIRADEPLAPHTTLELGGPARAFATARSEDELVGLLAWAEERALPAFVLGGGSNLVIPDAGFPGLVVQVGLRGLTFQPSGAQVLVTARAGELWDDVVAACVARGLAGLECLSGIPGRAGATPIQNVGAYGEDVAGTVVAVRVLDRRTRRVRVVDPSECAFGYRTSAFKHRLTAAVVLGVTFALAPGAVAPLRYPELAAALGDRPSPSLEEIREVVLRLRRGKSMVLDAADPNRRSAGSFFTNPIVPAAFADELARRAVSDGLAEDVAQVPRYPAGPGQVKLAAAWLIERAGISRGLRRGAVGVSSRHCLALVHHGGGSTAELLGLAREVRAAVEVRFGVRLVPEPVVLGASAEDPLCVVGGEGDAPGGGGGA
jgi:UDP-N-acetylmuramate dehydrogenase